MDWRDLARSQCGAIGRAQLRRLGLTEAVVQGLIGRRELVPVLPGVYRSRATPQTCDTTDWAAVLWSDGVLSHAAAARWWRLPVAQPPHPHVTVGDRLFRGRVEAVCVHRVLLARRDVQRCAGLAITSRSRTIVDLLRTQPYGHARDLRDRALQCGWLAIADVTRSVSEQLGRTGNAQLRRLVAEVEVGAQAESERILHAILRRAALRGWVAQHRVRLETRTAYLDVAFPKAKLAIEVDGRAAHGPWSDRFDGDRERQNALIAAGWRVLRFTWVHLQDPDYVVRAIVQLLPA